MKKLKSFAVLTLLLALSVCARAAQGGLDPRTASFPMPEFTAPRPLERTLSGGAPLYLKEDHDIPLVRVYLYFAGGSVNDPEGREGLSDVTGTVWRLGGTAARGSEEFDRLLDSKGITLDLSMGREAGSVRLTALSRDLEQGLDLAAELLFSPALSADRFDWAVKEKKDDIAREEDDPDVLAFRELRKVLYAGHPRSRVATVKSVDGLKREDALELRRALVGESSWVLGAVGDFSPDELSAKLEKRFGKLPAKASARFMRPPVPRLPQPGLVVVPKKLPQTTLLWATLAPGLLSPARAPLELADFILGGGGFQSRLAKRIRIEKGLAYSVSSFYSPMEDFGVLGVQATTATKNTEEVFRLLSEEVSRAGASPFLEGELEDARRTEQNRYIFRFRDPADLVTERMSLKLRGLPPDLVERYYRELGAVGVESLGRAGADVYKPETGVWVLVGEVAGEGEAIKGPWKRTIIKSE